MVSGARSILGVLAASATAVATLGGPAPGVLAQEPAPGAPGGEADYLPADKTGFGTSRSRASKVWYTLEGGELSEVYYPNLSTPSTRELQLVVTDGATFAVREREGTTQRTELAHPGAPIYRQVNTDKARRWRVTKTYVTDPARASVVIDVRFESLSGRPYRVFVLHDPDLTNNGDDDSATSTSRALLAGDAGAASALVARPGFVRASSGYLGTSDGWTDINGDFAMNWAYGSAPSGNVVQTARTRLDGVRTQRLTLSLGFGATTTAALEAARASRTVGFARLRARYAAGWERYLGSLKEPPASLGDDLEQRTYAVSQMMLAGAEDKTHPGAFVASPSMPWAWAFNDELARPTGPYHLVWPRDQYHMGTALLAAGDRAAAGRALDYMWNRQQQPDGHLPQNTHVDGTIYWQSIQLDQTADPIILAWHLGRTDAVTWGRVKRAADFIVGYGPRTQQERWEEQDGYSPASIAAAIAGLVCAAELARANGDAASADTYLRTADLWQAGVDAWTATSNGPYGPKPYYLRLTKDQDPNAATAYDIGNGSFQRVDQRAVVDPSFLELVRLGVKPPNAPVVLNSIEVVDERISRVTPNGRHWYRYDFDGYGETPSGDPWNVTFPSPGPWSPDAPDGRPTRGRLWPIFAGERGEYELAAGGSARARLRDMARTGTEGYLLPEQVWDTGPPSTPTGPFRTGEGTLSATPLLWTHAQYIRLPWSLQAGYPVERPGVVACRYAGVCRP
jgi:glucoamylase